jgi:hypothetical protein
MKLNE